jgi:hypothetical protein
MAMVGHKTESIYRRYAIVDATSLREAADRIDGAALLSKVKGTSPGQMPKTADRRGRPERVKPANLLGNLVPEVGIEPTRGVNPTGF